MHYRLIHRVAALVVFVMDLAPIGITHVLAQLAAHRTCHKAVLERYETSLLYLVS